MADEPRKFFSRAQPQVNVQNFLNQLVESSPDVVEMRKALEQADRDVDVLNGRIRILEQELNRVNRQAAIWMHTANDLRVSIEVIVTSAVQSADQCQAASKMVIDQAKAALTAAKGDLAKQGMAMVEAPAASTNIMPDEDLKKLGETFGANARKGP